MSHGRFVSTVLGIGCILVWGCTSTTPAKKAHHHGAKINISDFMNHTAAYKGKTITLILKIDESSTAGKASQPEKGTREVKFTTVGPKGEHLNLVIGVPEEVSVPEVGPSDDVVVTFVCTQGSLRQGNHAKAVQIPDGAEDD
jgi:hypothetical protein